MLHASYVSEKLKGSDLFPDGQVKQGLKFDDGLVLRPARKPGDEILGVSEGFEVVAEKLISPYPNSWIGRWKGIVMVHNDDDYDTINVEMSLSENQVVEFNKLFLKSVNEFLSGAVVNRLEEVKTQHWSGTWSTNLGELYLRLTERSSKRL